MVINGVGRPRLMVTDASHGVDNPLQEVRLPYCEKLTETFEPIQTRHQVQAGIRSVSHGFWYRVRLDYSGYLDGQSLLDMARALNSVCNGQEGARALVLTPREDVPSLNYNVILDKEFSMALIPEQGHSDVVYEFAGTDIEPGPPAHRTGYGSSYGGGTAGYGYEL